MAVNVESIDLFFQTSNQEHTIKQRGMVLCHLSHPPSEYLENPVWGDKWTHMYSEWMKVVDFIAMETDVPEYNRIMVISEGDNIDVLFYQDDFQVAYQRIDVMYGIDTLSRFPKLLYLPDVGVFEESYTKYYYEIYLDRYISCDSTLTEPKPSWEVYETEVRKYNSWHPFFVKLRESESNNKREKEMVVNQSISSYLEMYGGQIKLDVVLDKFNTSQEGKIYVLCCEGAFHVEIIEMMDLEFMGITQNTVQVRSGEAVFSLLLCWRNRKGISYPSWKISIES